MTDRIDTQRLTLRRARADDLAAVYDMMRQPAAMRYWSTPAHGSVAQSKIWLDRMIARPRDTSDDFLIAHQGRVIGMAGSGVLPEIGYLIHPDHWRQGFAHEAMVAVIAHLFTRRQQPHLVAEVDPRNAASLGLLAKLGFVETHRLQNTLQWGDEWCDSVFLRLDRPRS